MTPLVLIQGSTWARYEGRAQGPIVLCPPEFIAEHNLDVRATLEDFRVNGVNHQPVVEEAA